jgi:hypothetical protein
MISSIKLTIVILLVSAFAGGLSAQSFTATGHIKPLSTKRVITGTVFIDKNGDGRYSAETDEPVPGAYVTINGNAVISDANGAYVFRNLKAGKVEVLVMSARGPECEPVVIELGQRPVMRRAVNIPVKP